MASTLGPNRPRRAREARMEGVMSERPTVGSVSRRELLELAGLGAAAALGGPAPALAQVPKRGGTLTIRAWDPPHFDPYLIIAFKTQVIRRSWTFTTMGRLPTSRACSSSSGR
jgi:hypothetical protein